MALKVGYQNSAPRRRDKNGQEIGNLRVFKMMKKSEQTT